MLKHYKVLIAIVGVIMGLIAIPANAATVSITGTTYGSATVVVVEKYYTIDKIDGRVQEEEVAPNAKPAKGKCETRHWASSAYINGQGKIVANPHENFVARGCPCPESVTHSTARFCEVAPVHCMNGLWPKGEVPPIPKIHVKFIAVKKFIRTLHLKVVALMQAHVSGKLLCGSGGGFVEGGASASGSINFSWSGSGTNKGTLLSRGLKSLKFKADNSVTLKVNAKGQAKAHLDLTCTVQPPQPVCTNGGTNYPVCTPPPPPPCTVTNTCPPPPPPTHWTQVTCTGFEEISGGGSFLVDCAVSDDNGAPIGLSVSTSPYYTVSGINCLSQSGAPSCTGNGTYEFRVDGVNNTSQIQQASMTITATANGVPAPFQTDFNVDPINGGFSKKGVKETK